MTITREVIERMGKEHRIGSRVMVENAEKLLAEPFRGVTTDGRIRPGLFSIAPTGVSTAGVRAAAEAFLASLSPVDRERAVFPVDTQNWRRWSNVHMTLMRHGVPLAEMTDAQREAAYALLAASFSERGYRVSRDIMKLNFVLGDITGRFDEFTEDLYWVSIMGTPSATEPWGWQIDGHHLNVNYFVLGDQVVMTPVFMGSEPTHARNGKYAGTRVMLDEQVAGLALYRALNGEQQREALLMEGLPPELFFSAFHDNVTAPYEGTCVAEFSQSQRDLLRRVLDVYVGYMPEGHAKVRMAEIDRYLDETYFGWIGESDNDNKSVFYYRIHSPVILVEFEHPRLSPIRAELADLLPDGDTLGAGRHTQNHIHTVVRTPNGNDYGADLLRQHHAKYDHTLSGHVLRT
jgi:hypothetical protein